MKVIGCFPSLEDFKGDRSLAEKVALLEIYLLSVLDYRNS
jgi:hypothetical protein